MNMQALDIKFEKNEKKTKNVDIINNRYIINGVDDGLMQISPLKHPFADEIFKIMLKNTWVPGEVAMGRDIEMWNDPHILSENEKRVYKRSLAFVSNLDGIQTNNLVQNILRQITSPEVCLALVRQSFEEALHVYSYSTMIESLKLDPDQIYGMYRRDLDLYNKNKYVLRSLGKIANPTFKTGNLKADQDFLEACIANIILEGIYFYSAFMVFYVFRRNNKMPGSAEMIQFINRDEDMHLKLFINITKTIIEEQPELWTPEFQSKMVNNICGACEHETEWGLSCINEGISGLNPQNLTDYIQFITDIRLKTLGLPAQYHKQNPFPWIDEITQGSMIEVNFFEGTVKEYASGTLDWD